MKRTGRPAWPALVALQVVVSGALGAAWWVNADSPEGPTDPNELSSEAYTHASAVLRSQHQATRQNLTSALYEDAQGSVSAFVALQVQAADLQLHKLDWVALPPQGDLVPVELMLDASGPALNLPILVDGLYRQARPMLLAWLSVETDPKVTDRVNVQLRARFFRPRELTDDWLRGHTEQHFGRMPEQTHEALSAAGQLQVLDAFAAQVPTLKGASELNRRAVVVALPRVLRKLPSSPLGWVGLDASGPTVKLLTDPGRTLR